MFLFSGHMRDATIHSCGIAIYPVCLDLCVLISDFMPVAIFPVLFHHGLWLTVVQIIIECGFASVFTVAYFASTFYSREEVWILFKKFNILSLECEYLSLLSFLVDFETLQIQKYSSYWKDVAIKLHSALPCNIEFCHNMAPCLRQYWNIHSRSLLPCRFFIF